MRFLTLVVVGTGIFLAVTVIYSEYDPTSGVIGAAWGYLAGWYVLKTPTPSSKKDDPRDAA